jgi:hypothetical protein
MLTISSLALDCIRLAGVVLALIAVVIIVRKWNDK